MRWLRRTLVLALVMAGWWVLSAGVASASSSIESCFVSKINGERSARGIKTMAVDSRLVTIARRHSQRMANDGTIYHNSNLANEAPSEWISLGENVGMGPDCSTLHKAFMDSASHRKNILNSSFNFIGVGVVVKGGTIYVTQVFMEAPQKTSTSSPTKKTTSSTSSGSTGSSTPKSSTAAPRPAPAPAPAPSPSPLPPGSKVTGYTQFYFDLLEGDPQPNEAELARHRAALKLKAEEELRATKAENQKQEEEQGVFSRLAAFIAAVLSVSH